MKSKTRNYLIGGTLLAAGTVALLNQLKVTPKGVTPVKPFDAKKYMGKWYEIARMKNMFERHLDFTTAEYTLNSDGSIRVVNSGIDAKTGEEKQVEGKAVFAGDEDEARLKVTFFGPFFSGYNVAKIDPDYKYALVVGKNHHYMWLMSRTNDMPPHIRKEYLQEAMALGYNITNLTWPDQGRMPGGEGDYCIYSIEEIELL